MEAAVGNLVGPQIHVRLEGRSWDIPLNELDVGVLSTDNQIREAVAQNTGIPVAKFRGFDIERDNVTGEMTIFPSAIFGI